MDQHNFEILVNEYFDGVSSDEQTQELFRELSVSPEYRRTFSSFLKFRETLNLIHEEKVPGTLDRRIKKIVEKKMHSVKPDASPMRIFFRKRISFSTPVFATLLALVIVGTIVLSTKFSIPVQPSQTEYIYVMQLPEIEVHEATN